MHEASLRWAAQVLEQDRVEHAPLAGGMTSTMLALSYGAGEAAVLRLMTEEPWRTHGPELVRREREAMSTLAATSVPAPSSIAIDATGHHTEVAAHLMTRVPGTPTTDLDEAALRAMAELLAEIHAVTPEQPFRTFQSWAWEAKWQVPDWTSWPSSWERAFSLLAEDPPAYEPTFLHRDFGHRNLLWTGSRISGVVDWVETSTGPRWLDAAHAATNLAITVGPESARRFLTLYAEVSGHAPVRHWLVMDAVGFLPPPGRAMMFAAPSDRAALDAWLHDVVSAIP